MNTEIEEVFHRALLSHNPQALFDVAQAFNELGENEKARVLMRRVILWNRIHDNEYVFGYDQLYYTTVQKRLNELGTNPQLVVDGKWGAKSKAACIAFQKSKGLIADAIPGTKTLAALGITSTISSSMGHIMPHDDAIDAAAYSTAKKAGAQIGMTEQEIQYVVSVAKGEGGYGNSWGNPNAKTLQESKTFGITGYEGVGSNN